MSIYFLLAETLKASLARYPVRIGARLDSESSRIYGLAWWEKLVHG